MLIISSVFPGVLQRAAKFTAGYVRLVGQERLVLIFALPLDFHGRVRVVKSMYMPAALHGLEASLLASDSLRKLRSSIHRVVWSRRQPLACVGAALSLLDGPTGCDPALCVVWFRFRLLRRYLALWPVHVRRVYRLLEMIGEGAPGRKLRSSIHRVVWSRRQPLASVVLSLLDGPAGCDPAFLLFGFGSVCFVGISSGLPSS